MTWGGVYFRENGKPSRRPWTLSGKGRGKRHGEFLKNKQGGVQMLGQGKGSYRDPKARGSERLLHNPKMGDDSL